MATLGRTRERRPNKATLAYPDMALALRGLHFSFDLNARFQLLSTDLWEDGKGGELPDLKG